MMFLMTKLTIHECIICVCDVHCCALCFAEFNHMTFFLFTTQKSHGLITATNFLLLIMFAFFRLPEPIQLLLPKDQRFILCGTAFRQ